MFWKGNWTTYATHCDPDEKKSSYLKGDIGLISDSNNFETYMKKMLNYINYSYNFLVLNSYILSLTAHSVNVFYS